MVLLFQQLQNPINTRTFERDQASEMLLLDQLARRRPRSLSLMTFNVLAPCYFRHGGRVESDDRAAFLARAQALIHAIQRERCDLVCLQEYWFNREYQTAFRKAFYPSHYIHTLKRPGTDWVVCVSLL